MSSNPANNPSRCLRFRAHGRQRRQGSGWHQGQWWPSCLVCAGRDNNGTGPHFLFWPPEKAVWFLVVFLFYLFFGSPGSHFVWENFPINEHEGPGKSQPRDGNLSWICPLLPGDRSQHTQSMLPGPSPTSALRRELELNPVICGCLLGGVSWFEVHSIWLGPKWEFQRSSFRLLSQKRETSPVIVSTGVKTWERLMQLWTGKYGLAHSNTL